MISTNFFELRYEIQFCGVKVVDVRGAESVRNELFLILAQKMETRADGSSRIRLNTGASDLESAIRWLENEAEEHMKSRFRPVLCGQDEVGSWNRSGYDPRDVTRYMWMSAAAAAGHFWLTNT